MSTDKDTRDVERLVAEIERITGCKVLVTDYSLEQEERLRKEQREQEERLREVVSGYHTRLELAADSLKCNDGDAQSVVAALETLWEMEPFDVELSPPRDYGITEHPGKSLGSVRVVSRDNRVKCVADGHGEKLAGALSGALDDTLTVLRRVVAGETEPEPDMDIPF